MSFKFINNTLAVVYFISYDYYLKNFFWLKNLNKHLYNTHH